ncbi:CBS domain-containing protein [Pseudogemmobacter sonorensis]|uniref:CBS domain-containing protein n=1 Tax=Pseudogemmobacter sonorensis TaxID=2989681 RepID=UPI003692BFE3
MIVSQILGLKADPSVVTIAPQASIAEAVALLAGRRIGALVVSADGRRAEGILSERDIVRGLAGSGADCLLAQVDTLMTRRLLTCARGDAAVEVLTRMTEGRFRHMPVIEAGELVGLISIGDVVKARLDELRAERDALESMIKGH